MESDIVVLAFGLWYRGISRRGALTDGIVFFHILQADDALGKQTGEEHSCSWNRKRSNRMTKLVKQYRLFKVYFC